MTTLTAPRFTAADAERAYAGWGANCGPGALAAIMGMTLDEVRPHLKGFDAKRYTNPTMMFDALRSIGGSWCNTPWWPRHGLVRIQWEGPWTEPGVPMVRRYRYTHWVGGHRAARDDYGVFDINCINNGSGWVSHDCWREIVVPFLTSQHPRANGRWHITHAIEVLP